MVNGFDVITTDIPEKSLLEPKKKSGGRNNKGKMTMKHRGGGHKRRYRLIDFKRNNFGIIGKVKSVEYDPNRTSYISLIEYKGGDKRYIIAQSGIKVWLKITSG